MEILEAKWIPSDTKILQTGNVAYNGSLHLLVDKIPEVVFKKMGDYLYGENEGYVRLYHYQKGTTRGFAGRTITLDLEGFGEMDFVGSLWDPMGPLPDNIPKFFSVGITEDPEDMERGNTFMAGKITWDLAKSTFDSIPEDGKVEISRGIL